MNYFLCPLQKELMHGYERFYSTKRLIHILITEGWRSFYGLFSGRYSVMPAVRAMENYLFFLKKKEEGLYDTQEILLEDKLLSEYTRSKESQHEDERH